MSVWEDMWWALRGRMSWRVVLSRIRCELISHDDRYTYGFYQCARCYANALVGPDRRGWLS